ncbi:MAG TPA: hypothetical protein ENJ09_10470 [Planctomycetes bacterium]|nr:hypothetical protein [Planctomycetota bacterium]
MRPPDLRGAIPTLLTVLLVASACREGQPQSSFAPIAAPAFGTDGCNGSNLVFGSVQEVYSDPSVIGPMSQLAGSATDEVLYLTGADGTVRALDFGASATIPVESTVLAAGAVDALLGAVFSAPSPALLSGISVLDPSNLVVVEHTSNTVLIVSLVNPGQVAFYVGFPDETPGFTDSVAGAARFSFPPTVPAQIVASGDGRLFIADPGNHAVREVTLGQSSVVSTLAGVGIPLSLDGPSFQAGFDQPTGLAISCGGELLVTENGPTGEKLRSIAPGPPSFFGPPAGRVTTLAGDGQDQSSDGIGGAASLAGPVAPVMTSGGDIYFVDGDTGILRRQALATGVVDCPLFVDCDAANLASGSFSGPGAYSLALSASGALYVLDGTAGKIYLVTP